MFSIDQNFLYSLFLILEFLFWASCPWPNHCCLTQVTQHGEQNKRRVPVCHHPVQRPPFLDLNGPHQHLHLPWWHWHNYHSAFQSLAQHSLQCYHMWPHKAFMKLHEMSCRNSQKEEKCLEYNLIHTLQTVLSSLLLVHGQAQTKSESV